MTGVADSLMDLSRLSYAVVDVETTGGSPQTGHRITEIAVVVVREGRIVEIYEQLVNPERYISPWITRLTGIDGSMVAGQPRFEDIAADVVTALAGNIFVAHNAAFDWRFVSAELERSFDKTPKSLRLCTVQMARTLLPHLPRKSLDYVAHHYGVRDVAHRYALKRDCRHSAAGDAVVTAHCLLRMLDDAADRGFMTWSDMNRALSGRRRSSLRPSALPTSTLGDRIA
jgi:DNA polymerase III epsilon subunit family exonuclease